MAAQTAIRAEILEDLQKLSEQRLSEVRDLVHALVASEIPQTLRFAADDPLGDVRRQEAKPRAVAASPEEALDEIRALLSEGRITEARSASLDAAQRFPENAAVRDAKTILNDGQARAGSRGNEPSTQEEFEWLRRPPAWARGKWVALLGREVVAMAETLSEVVKTIESLGLPRQPLVHHID